MRSLRQFSLLYASLKPSDEVFATDFLLTYAPLEPTMASSRQSNLYCMCSTTTFSLGLGSIATFTICSTRPSALRWSDLCLLQAPPEPRMQSATKFLSQYALLEPSLESLWQSCLYYMFSHRIFRRGLGDKIAF